MAQASHIMPKVSLYRYYTYVDYTAGYSPILLGLLIAVTSTSKVPYSPIMCAAVNRGSDYEYAAVERVPGC